ncbi:MAG: hypothetical protein GX195_12160 [Firmicutes bacterium]|mgnify:FL=1|jgi:hypothetical protein|nr:hypothetical protein [Bacillota bacterium]
MSKLVNQPVEVVLENGFPRRFFFQKPFFIRHIQEYWREAGQWWLGEPERMVYLVVTDYGLNELHYIPKNDCWLLYRL